MEKNSRINLSVQERKKLEETVRQRLISHFEANSSLSWLTMLSSSCDLIDTMGEVMNYHSCIVELYTVPSFSKAISHIFTVSPTTKHIQDLFNSFFR